MFALLAARRVACPINYTVATTTTTSTVRIRRILPQCAADGHVEERSHLHVHATKEEERVRTSPDKTINWLLLLLLLLPSR
eukprot:COSAG06_NODE_4289_length_4396_cov_2.229230_1_plen_81_part_00